MKNKLYIFTAILVSLFSLTSCGLEEPYTPEKNPDAVIEFVGRPVGFNNQDVDTKSPASGIENTVNACYFLLFDATTGGILYRTGGDAELLQNFRIPKTELAAKGITSVTACYLVNVPKTFAEGLKYLEKTSSAASGKNPGDNECLSTAVIDIPSYQSGTPMGVPVIDGKAGIPMYGQTTKPIDLSKYTTPYEIPVKRLFAKATVSLKMDLTNGGSGLQANSYMQMTSYAIYNLPQKVKLTEVTLEDGNYECAWVKNAGTGLSTTSSNKIYNQAATGIITDLPKELVFHCYVPEYYLLPKLSSTQEPVQEEYKPLMFDNTDNNRKYPVYIQLNGSYEPVSGVSQNLTYKIYLGENASTNFTLKRNTHYTNNLVIKGVENKADGTNGKIDHRVTITQGNVVSMYGEVANCYMIGKEGKYNFPAYKGAYKYAQLKDAPMCTSGKAKIIASDNKSIWLKDENITVTIDELTGEKIITINVTNGDYTANEDIPINAAGNAIIALVDDKDNIEWSWHLWFTGGLNWGVAGMEFFEMTTQPYPSGADMMDRNLGATALGGDGLYYQYGNKNPFINNEYRGGGTNEPNTWDPANDSNTSDATKAVNDPCPPGYKVPSSSVWSGSKGTAATTDALFSFSISPAIGYSYTGWLDSTNSNKYSNTVSGKDDIIDAEDFSIDISKSEGNVRPGNTPNERKKEYRIVTITERKYVNIKYNVPTTQKFGAFWTSISNTHLKYYNYRADWSQLSLSNLSNFITITACDVMENIYDVEQVREKGLIFWGDWKDINGTKKTISNNTTKGDPTKINSTSNKTALFYDQRDLATLGARNVQSVPNTPNGNGCKIRCVSELSKIK